MPNGTKIATCCYCGTRAALVLRGETRHELACSACGAPLHDLKAMPVDRRGAAKASPARKPAPLPDWLAPKPARTPSRKPARPPGRRKSLKRRLLSEAIDLIDDIFD